MFDVEIAELASAQCSLFSRRQAIALGATRSMVQHRVRARRWLVMAPGVYSMPGVAQSWHRQLWIAYLHAGPRSAVSHEAAAALHGLLNYPPGAVTLIAPHGDHHRASRFARVHQSRDISPGHLTRVDGLPVTTIARTFCDLSSTSRRGRLERAIDDAHLARRCSVPDVLKLATTLSRPGKPGLRQLLDILEARGSGAAVPESELERVLAKVLVDGGFTGFTIQHELPWRPRVPNRVDILFSDDKAIIEADSRRWHGRVDSMVEDRRRDRDAQNHGYRVYRFLYEEVIYDRDEIWRVLRAAVGARDSGPIVAA